ncbi:DNA repair protein RecO [Natranaerofaba carboxydovora]|uniref:DNA repair protein RecO n=1 Tax=Natranaerofaba carboxydovora TaxID=2742683 RepID=UPI001F142183|nr:DNA repair protein RecO [Natranaerofaba carboxydovora]UMZ73091.1 DNA repair protein RecO [Natranaerofaba carboxydovora]
MSNKLFTTEGLILKTTDYKENAKLVTLFTPGHGKISAIAKGVNKKNSKMRSFIQIFVYGDFQVYAGKNLYTITQGKVHNYFPGIRDDLESMYRGIYILEILEKITVEEESYDLFFLALSSLYLLNSLKDNRVVLLFFQIKILENLGITPYLDSCINGHHISDKLGFDLVEGGILCEICMSRIDRVYKIQRGSYKILEFLQKATLEDLKKLKLSSSQCNEIWKLLNDFLESQTGINLKSKSFLTSI